MILDDDTAGEAIERDPPILRVLTQVASVLLAATVALTFAQVVLRFGFNNPQAWAEETGRYLFAWITFIGAAVAVGRDTHIRVDVLVERFGARGQWILNIFRNVVELVAFAVMLYAGALVVWQHRASEFYTIPELPRAIFFLAIPVAALFMLFFLARRVGPPSRRLPPSI